MARKIILGKGREMAFNEGKMPVYESVEEWQAEGKRRFGEDVKNGGLYARCAAMQQQCRILLIRA